MLARLPILAWLPIIKNESIVMIHSSGVMFETGYVCRKTQGARRRQDIINDLIQTTGPCSI